MMPFKSMVRVSSQAGIAPPAALPVLSKIAGGTLAATTYFVRISYLTASGETAASLEASLLVAAGNLLQVASPPVDPQSLATGWNVYVGTAAGQETQQNTSPIAIGSAWTEPASGLISGAALPQMILAIENAGINVGGNQLGAIPTALIEGVDFTADRATGQLTRFFTDGYPRRWPALPLLIQYPGGHTTIPADLQEAIVLTVKKGWFARARDPMLKQENIAGAYEASYWISAFMDRGAMTPEVTSLLDAYRVPVFG